MSNKLKWLQSRPDKQLETDAGRALLSMLENFYHSDQTDALMPWIVREWRKKRITHRDFSLDVAHTGQTLLPADIDHWSDWFRSNHPTRRGQDIIQLTIGDLLDLVAEWDEDMRQEAARALAEGNLSEQGPLEYSFDDGWSVRRLEAIHLAREGQLMGHCVGGHEYQRRAQTKEMLYFSLRDAQGRPHVTIEILPGSTGDLDGGRVIQIMGRANTLPKDEYVTRLRAWFFSMDLSKRPRAHRRFERVLGVTDYQMLLTHSDLENPQPALDEYGLAQAEPPERVVVQYPLVLESCASTLPFSPAELPACSEQVAAALVSWAQRHAETDKLLIAVADYQARARESNSENPDCELLVRLLTDQLRPALVAA